MSATEDVTSERQVHLHTCPLFEAICGLEIHVRDERVDLIAEPGPTRGLPDTPMGRSLRRHRQVDVGPARNLKAGLVPQSLAEAIPL